MLLASAGEISLGLVGVAIWIGAVLIVIAPLAIWIVVARIRKEQHEAAAKTLEAIGAVYEAIDRLTNTICQAQ